jgi:hypothetical protein
MIGCLSKHLLIALRVWGPQEAIGYMFQYSSNFARRVQCSSEVGVQVLGEERILPLEPSFLFS